MATHSSIHTWEIPWTEEPVWLQSSGVTKGRTRLSKHTHTHTHICMHTHTYMKSLCRTFMSTNFRQCEWAKKQPWAWVSEISNLLMFTLLSSACLFIFKQKYFSFYAFGFINFQITKKVFGALCDFTCVWVCTFLHFFPQIYEERIFLPSHLAIIWSHLFLWYKTGHFSLL